MTWEMSFKTAPVNKAGVYYHGVWSTDSAKEVNSHPNESINAALAAMNIKAVCVETGTAWETDNEQTGLVSLWCDVVLSTRII